MVPWSRRTEGGRSCCPPGEASNGGGRKVSSPRSRQTTQAYRSRYANSFTIVIDGECAGRDCGPSTQAQASIKNQNFAEGLGYSGAVMPTRSKDRCPVEGAEVVAITLVANAQSPAHWPGVRSRRGRAAASGRAFVVAPLAAPAARAAMAALLEAYLGRRSAARCRPARCAAASGKPSGLLYSMPICATSPRCPRRVSPQ